MLSPDASVIADSGSSEITCGESHPRQATTTRPPPGFGADGQMVVQMHPRFPVKSNGTMRRPNPPNRKRQRKGTTRLQLKRESSARVARLCAAVHRSPGNAFHAIAKLHKPGRSDSAQRPRGFPPVLGNEGGNLWPQKSDAIIASSAILAVVAVL